MKASKIIIVLFMLIPGIITAQGKHKHKEMMQERKIEFIKKELQLTKTEEEKIIPLLNEFEKKEEALHRKYKALFYKFEQNHLNLSESEIQSMNKKMAEIFEQEASLKTEYHEKYQAILPPVKVFLLYKARHDFKRMLIKEYRNRGRHGCFSPEDSPNRNPANKASGLSG
jgi:hypothetical protein